MHDKHFFIMSNTHHCHIIIITGWNVYLGNDHIIVSDISICRSPKYIMIFSIRYCDIVYEALDYQAGGPETKHQYCPHPPPKKDMVCE
jgi:hypothetical protein